MPTFPQGQKFDGNFEGLYSGVMYDSIKGLIAHLTPEYAVLENNGIGYKVFIPISLYTSGIALGSNCQLFTELVVREDDMKLYGFISRQERELFMLLTSISGIGARTAISIIGHVSVNDLHDAVQLKNTALLCKIPGIGKKSAERLVLELRDRIKPDTNTKISKNENHGLMSDATLALIRLGYNQKVAESAIKKAMDGVSQENIGLPKLITSALKNI